MSQAEDAFVSAVLASGYPAWAAGFSVTAPLYDTDPPAKYALLLAQYFGAQPQAFAALEPPFEALIAARPDLAFRLEAARSMAQLHANEPHVPWTPPPPTLDDLRTARIAEADAAYAGRIAAGFPYAGEVVQLDAFSTGKIEAIGSTAIAAIGGLLDWPDGYAQGWVTADDTHIPLPTPQDGLKFSAAVGAYFASLVQADVVVRKAIRTAGDAAAIAAVALMASA